MAYTETTKVSYGSRVGNSFRGIGSGFLLFIASTVLLWWNEGRAVKQSGAIKDAEKSYVSMDNPGKIDPALDGELVYACALATTTDSLLDADFGVSANAINMVRKVEFYQWQQESHSESHDKLGGSQETTTTYTYKLGWSDKPVDSQEFKDPQYQNKNVVLANVEKAEWSAQNVSFGAYVLPEFAVASLTPNEKLDVKVSENHLKAWENRLNPNAMTIEQKVLDMVAAAQKDTSKVMPDSIVVPKMEFDSKYIHVGGNQIYLGQNPSQPMVGDVRITYFVCSPTKCSLIAKVQGNTFTRYKAKNGKMFSMVQKGVAESDEMIQNAKDANSTWTWILRIVGLLLLYSAFRGILGFPEMLLKVVPFLSSILGIGIGFISFLLTVIWGGLVIAVAWIFYRPILSIAILVVVAACVFLLWKRKKTAKAEN